jgi:hypothetical protein
MAIASLEIVTGGASAPPTLLELPMSRMMTDGLLGRWEGGHAKAA